MSERNELKRVLADFPIKKPFPLKRTAVELKPPAPVGDNTGVGNQVQVEKPSQVSNPTPVDNQAEVGKTAPALKTTTVEYETLVAKTTEVENHTPVVITAQAEKDTQVVIPAPIQNTTGVTNQTQVNIELPNPTATVALSLSHRSTEQDSSVVLEARASDSLQKGYTRLPNTVLMRLVSGDCTRNEIKLALLIARFTISFQRRLAPLSKAVLARLSGLRDSAVLEAISGLVHKGFVEKQQGDQHRPNMLGLVLPPDWDLPPKSRSKIETTQVENHTQVEKVTGVEKLGPAPVEKATPAEAGNLSYFKDIERYKNSLSELPEQLRKYFDELKPAKKRESEWKAFGELQSDYTAEDIADCLAFVQKRGIGSAENLQPCHSPMAYLGKAISEILREVEGCRKKARERTEREQQEATAERQRCEIEAREATEWVAKERAFVKAFPSEERQREVLVEFLRGLPFSPKSQAGRIMVIGKWWNSLNGYERAELSN